MSNAYFDFKKFRVCHDRCAMKVGTDAVLLGAWAKVETARHILDVGSGSGVISLMVAQRAPQAFVTGIDIDNEAVLQANENAQRSPFSERVSFLTCDVKDYEDSVPYDCILSNPPFYSEDTLPPDLRRSMARNCYGLSYDALIKHVHRLLADGGLFHVILPFSSQSTFTCICEHEGLSLMRICNVRTTSKKQPKRTLCTYSTVQQQTTEVEELVLMENGVRGDTFQRLTADFYLETQRPS